MDKKYRRQTTANDSIESLLESAQSASSSTQQAIYYQKAINQLRLGNILDGVTVERTVQIAGICELCGNWDTALNEYARVIEMDAGNAQATSFLKRYENTVLAVRHAIEQVQGRDIAALSPEELQGIHSAISGITQLTSDTACISPYLQHKPHVVKVTLPEVGSYCCKIVDAQEAQRQIEGFEHFGEHMAPRVYTQMGSRASGKIDLLVKHIEGTNLYDHFGTSPMTTEERFTLLSDITNFLADFQTRSVERLSALPESEYREQMYKNTMDYEQKTASSLAQAMEQCVQDPFRRLVVESLSVLREGQGLFVAHHEWRIVSPEGASIVRIQPEIAGIELYYPRAVSADLYPRNLIMTEEGVKNIDGGKTYRLTSVTDDIAQILESPLLSGLGWEDKRNLLAQYYIQSQVPYIVDELKGLQALSVLVDHVELTSSQLVEALRSKSITPEQAILKFSSVSSDINNTCGDSPGYVSLEDWENLIQSYNITAISRNLRGYIDRTREVEFAQLQLEETDLMAVSCFNPEYQRTMINQGIAATEADRSQLVPRREEQYQALLREYERRSTEYRSTVQKQQRELEGAVEALERDYENRLVKVRRCEKQVTGANVLSDLAASAFEQRKHGDLSKRIIVAYGLIRIACDQYRPAERDQVSPYTEEHGTNSVIMSEREYMGFNFSVMGRLLIMYQGMRALRVG